MTELIEEEKKNLEDDKFKMIADDTLEKHRAIYLGTWSAWDNGYKLSSDDVAAISALDEDGGVYTVVIALPDDSEETIDTAVNILSSFSQHEEA